MTETEPTGCLLCGKPLEWTVSKSGVHIACLPSVDEIPSSARIAELINEESDRIGGWKHALGKLFDPVSDRNAADSEPVQDRERWGPVTREAFRLAAEAWHAVQKRLARGHCVTCRTVLTRPMSHDGRG